MDWLKRIGSMVRRRQSERDLDNEIEHHIELKTQENIDAGMPPDEARYAARQAFGGVEQKKEQCRDADRLRWLEDLIHDLHFGLRQLRRNPGFTAVAVITLALGIGANTAIFSLIDAVLLKALPVQNPADLVLLNWSSQGWADGIITNVAGEMNQDKTGRMTSPSFSYAVYREIRSHSRVFSGILALAGNDSESI
jgi:hypothetical protein